MRLRSYEGPFVGQRYPSGLPMLATQTARHSLPARRALRTWAAVARDERRWAELAAQGTELRLAYRHDGLTGELAVRRHPMDSMVLRGAELLDADAAGSYEPHMLPLPETRRPPRTHPRPDPEAPTAEEQAAFKARFKHWSQCYTPEGLQRRLKWLSDAFRDARHACDTSGAVNASGHRPRQRKNACKMAFR